MTEDFINHLDVKIKEKWFNIGDLGTPAKLIEAVGNCDQYLKLIVHDSLDRKFKHYDIFKEFYEEIKSFKLNLNIKGKIHIANYILNIPSEYYCLTTTSKA